MNSCSKNREDIALLAMGALEIPRQKELRAHLAGCPGCRGYHEEIARVANALGAAPNPGNHPTDLFHRNVVRALASAERESAGKMLLAHVASLLNWRVALPAIAAVALVIVAWQVAVRRPETRAAAPALAASGKLERNTDLAPTFSNYEMAARQSLDKLDELLTEQGNRNPPSPDHYASDWLGRANGTD